jgi:hypothetical protein
LEANHIPGVRGQPRDKKDRSQEIGLMITDYLADCAVASAEPVVAQKVASFRRSGGGCR